jgi:hypothetical protein
MLTRRALFVGALATGVILHPRTSRATASQPATPVTFDVPPGAHRLLSVAAAPGRAAGCPAEAIDVFSHASLPCVEAGRIGQRHSWR